MDIKKSYFNFIINFHWAVRNDHFILQRLVNDERRQIYSTFFFLLMSFCEE